MKRTRRINLEAMRKQPRLGPRSRLSLAIAGTVALSGCDSREEAVIYRTVVECEMDHPGQEQICEAAYQKALSEAEQTAPKYKTQQDCEYEFGLGQCVQQQSTSWFMPLMAGYLVGRALDWDDDVRRYRGYSNPVFTSSRRNSRIYGEYIGAGGGSYGSVSQRSYKVDRTQALKSKPATTRTLSRGGFGSKVAAKSSWGSSGKSSWGG